MLNLCFAIQQHTDGQFITLTDETGVYDAVYNPGGWWPEAPVGQQPSASRVNPTRSESQVKLQIIHTLTGRKLAPVILSTKTVLSDSYEVGFGDEDGVYTLSFEVSAKGGQSRFLESYSLVRPASSGLRLWVERDGAWVDVETEVVSDVTGRTWTQTLGASSVKCWREINASGVIVAQGGLTPIDAQEIIEATDEYRVVATYQRTQLIDRLIRGRLAKTAARLTYQADKYPTLTQQGRRPLETWVLGDSRLMALNQALPGLSIFTAERELTAIAQLLGSIPTTSYP